MHSCSCPSYSICTTVILCPVRAYSSLFLDSCSSWSQSAARGRVQERREGVGAQYSCPFAVCRLRGIDGRLHPGALGVTWLCGNRLHRNTTRLWESLAEHTKLPPHLTSEACYCVALFVTCLPPPGVCRESGVSTTCSMGCINRLYKDAQDRLLSKDKACPASA